MRASRFESELGQVVGALVVKMVQVGPRTGSWGGIVEFVERQTEELHKTPATSSRPHVGKLMTASMGISLGRHFLPPPEWAVRGVEEPLEDGRVDVVYELPMTDDAAPAVIVDEYKIALSRAAGREGPAIRQCREYAAAGRRIFGAAFLGVRLILLGAPRQSLFVAPDGSTTPLHETPYWFDRRPGMAEEGRAA